MYVINIDIYFGGNVAKPRGGGGGAAGGSGSIIVQSPAPTAN